METGALNPRDVMIGCIGSTALIVLINESRKGCHCFPHSCARNNFSEATPEEAQPLGF